MFFRHILFLRYDREFNFLAIFLAGPHAERIGMHVWAFQLFLELFFELVLVEVHPARV